MLPALPLEDLIRRLRLALGLATALLLWAAPGYGAETLTMNCPVCDHVDVSGAGLEPNARLTLVIRDVRTGQKVTPDMPVVASASGEFEREIDLDLSRHPALLADLYEKSGSTLALAAHTNAEAPAHCKRDVALPYTGAGTGPAAAAGTGLLVAGGLLLLAGRRRPGFAVSSPRP